MFSIVNFEYTEFLQKNRDSKILSFSHHSVEKREILSHWKKISSNHLFSNFFSKTIAFTEFLRKKCEREFLEFPHCAQHSVEFCKFPSHSCFRKNIEKIPWKQCSIEFYSKKGLRKCEFVINCARNRRNSTLATICNDNSAIRVRWQTWPRVTLDQIIRTSVYF